MSRAWILPLLLLAAPSAAVEPAPRKPAPVPIKMNPPPAHVSAAYELPDGRIVVSDAKTPAVQLIDPASGVVKMLGSVGAGEDQYVQPGGLYRNTDGGALLLDRAQLRVTAITPAGALGRTYSIAIKGVTGSSSADADLQRLDHRGYSYFAERFFGLIAGTSRPEIPLIRFDPRTQEKQQIGALRQAETTTIRDGNMSTSRSVVGSPADDFGVAPDGRVAIVRGEPYRVDWLSVDGKVTRGPGIAFDPVPMTDADKEAFKARMGRGGTASASASATEGGGGSMSGMPEVKFAPTKAPFSVGDVTVSPTAQVWVMRSRPATATTVVYDVFDARGQRIDRLEFPDGSRVVGFGAGSVYIRETAASGAVTLKKYKVR